MIFIYGEKLHLVATYDARSKVTTVEIGSKTIGVYDGYHPRDMDELPLAFMDFEQKFCIHWHMHDKGEDFVLEINGINVLDYDY